MPFTPDAIESFRRVCNDPAYKVRVDLDSGDIWLVTPFGQIHATAPYWPAPAEADGGYLTALRSARRTKQPPAAEAAGDNE